MQASEKEVNKTKYMKSNVYERVKIHTFFKWTAAFASKVYKI